MSADVIGLTESPSLLYIHISNYEDAVEFTWDERKNRVNQRKHGISFETAVLVFDDPYHVSLQDREVDGEPRWQTIGMAGGHHVLLVAHTVDESGRGCPHTVRKKGNTAREKYLWPRQQRQSE